MDKKLVAKQLLKIVKTLLADNDMAGLVLNVYRAFKAGKYQEAKDFIEISKLKSKRAEVMERVEDMLNNPRSEFKKPKGWEAELEKLKKDTKRNS